MLMEGAPTPNFMEKKNNNINKFDFELKKEVKSDKNNIFFLLFQIIDSKFSIMATSNDIIQKFTQILLQLMTVNEIKENKYFLQFEDL